MFGDRSARGVTFRRDAQSIMLQVLKHEGLGIISLGTVMFRGLEGITYFSRGCARCLSILRLIILREMPGKEFGFDWRDWFRV